MALHPNFPESPHAILDPAIRWFPADEALRESSMEKLMPPLVAELRRKVKEFRDKAYVGAADTSRSLLNWWFNKPSPANPHPRPLSLVRARGERHGGV
jgi:type III restriction enzyme